jgi:hypothetical protein
MGNVTYVTTIALSYRNHDRKIVGCFQRYINYFHSNGRVIGDKFYVHGSILPSREGKAQRRRRENVKRAC